MAYCTVADVQNAVGGASNLQQLSDWDKRNAIDTDVVDSKIAEADAMINTKAQLRFGVDFDTVPASIRYCSARLAGYYLRQARQALTEDDHKAYDRDVLFLEQLSKGEALPGVTPMPDKSEAVVDQQSDRPAEMAASRARMKGFV